MSAALRCVTCADLVEYVSAIFASECIDMNTHFLRTLSLLLLPAALAIRSLATEDSPPASPEVTVAMQPYLDGHKLAGVISIIAAPSR